MQPTYADMKTLLEAGQYRERPPQMPQMPMFGFVVGTGISLCLWAVIALSAWVIMS